MTRGKYLDMLERELTGLKRARVREIIVEIYGHFDEGEAAGLSEDEIAERLGEPGAVAAEYLQLYAAEIEREPEPAQAEGRGFIREEPYNVHEEFELNEGEDLDVGLASLAVSVIGYDGAKVQVDFHGYRTSDANGNRPSIETEKQGGKLRVWQQQPQVLAQGLFNILRGGFCQLRGQLSVMVPKKQLGHISVRSASGAIVARELSGKTIAIEAASGAVEVLSLRAEAELKAKSHSGAVKAERIEAAALEINSLSGSVQANEIQCDDAKISSTSGSVKSDSVEAANFANWHATSGSVKLSRITASDMKANSLSGSVTMNDAQIAGSADLNTTSGSVKCENVVAHSVSLNSMSGSVTLGSSSVASAKLNSMNGSVRADLKKPADIEAETKSGQIELTLARDGGFRFNAEAKNGHIEVDYPELQTTRFKRNASGTVGDGSKLVTARSWNGNIKIRPM